jgi:hypothetical protein
MGYESSAFATRRLRRFTDATRDVTLRAELLELIATPPDGLATSARHSPAVRQAPRAPGTTAMHTPPVVATASAQYASWTGELLAADALACTPSIPYESVDVPQLPVDHLVAGLAYGDVVRDLIASLAEHARVIALVREAHELGAASLPPEVAAALATAAHALPAALRGSLSLA